MNHPLLHSALEKIGQFIAPPYCSHCRTFLNKREPLCNICYASIAPIISTELVITPSHSMRVFALSDYENPLKKLILAKNHNNRVAATYLAQIMIKALPLNTIPCDYLIPVPLHWSRLLYRGFNQADIMAHTFSKYYKKPVIEALYRTRRTPFQSTLNAEERAHNVANVFAVMPEIPNLNNKNLVLVDDLMTTGSTLRAAAKLLLKSKPATITVLVACRKL